MVAPLPQRFMRLIVAACLMGQSIITTVEAIDAVDVPTFRMSCRVTNTLDGPPPPSPPLPAFPNEACALNVTAAAACKEARGICQGTACVPSNYSFTLGCDWYVACDGILGVETFSTGQDWSPWSAEYNISMANHSITTQKCYPHCFYESYPTLGVELGVRSLRKDAGILNVTCALAFTGKDAGKDTRIKGSLQNSDDPKANPASFTGWVGLMLGRENSTLANSAPQVRTYNEYNHDMYWSKVADIPTPKRIAKLFPIADMYSGDSTLEATADAFEVLTRMGINTPQGAEPKGWTGRRIGGFPAWGVGGEFRKGPGGKQVACYTPNSSCTMHDYCTQNATDSELVNATDLANKAAAAFPCQLNASSEACLNSPTADPTKVVMSAMADEPGWGAPLNIPTTTSSVVKLRWQTYLQARGLTPDDFGAQSWDAVVPNTARGAAGAGNSSYASNPLKLPARRLFYWSIRFAHWDSSRYMAEWTAALQSASGDQTLQTYVNWNNFDGRMYVPGANAGNPTKSVDTGTMSYDWFEWARLKGGSMLWTEDWMPDSASHRWSYYSARMRSAIALSNHSAEMSFSGYIVTRSSGSQAGGLLQRPITMVGSGAKALRYYNFGPEYMFPANCVSDSPNASRIMHEQAKANAMIAEAEDILFTAQRQPSQVAILYPRSSEMWDEWHTELATGMCMCCCVSSMVSRYIEYTVEAYGLYLAMATDSNIPVDFIDEDALEEPAVLKQYKLILLTEPDVPAKGMQGLLDWVRNDGGILAAVSNAGSGDEYNTQSVSLNTAAKVVEPPRKRLIFAGDESLPAGTSGTVSFSVGLGAEQRANSGAKESANDSYKSSTLSFSAPAGSYGALTPALFTSSEAQQKESDEAAAEILGTFADGSAAVTQTALGNGKIVRLGWLPGVSYWFSSPKGSIGNRPRSDTIRQIIAGLATELAAVEPPVTVSATRVETPLLLAPDKKAAVVTVLNFGAGLPVAPISSLQLNVSLPFLPTKVISVEHGVLAFKSNHNGDHNMISLTIPSLEFADFVKFS